MKLCLKLRHFVGNDSSKAGARRINKTNQGVVKSPHLIDGNFNIFEGTSSIVQARSNSLTSRLTIKSNCVRFVRLSVRTC